MERDLERQLLGYIEKIDRIDKQLSTFRKYLTKLIYRLPRDETPPIQLPKEKTARKPAAISETLSTSFTRYNRRIRPLNLDDFTRALEKYGMSVGQQVHQMSYMVGANTGCKVTVNGDVIAVYQYSRPLERPRFEDAVTNENLMMFKEVEHKDWDSILKVFNSL